MPGVPQKGAPDEIKRLEDALAEVWRELEDARKDIERREDLSGALWNVWAKIKGIPDCQTLERAIAIALDALPKDGEVYPPLLTRSQWEALYFHYTKNGIPPKQKAATELARKVKEYLDATDPAIARARDSHFLIAAEQARNAGLDPEAMKVMIDEHLGD